MTLDPGTLDTLVHELESYVIKIKSIKMRVQSYSQPMVLTGQQSKKPPDTIPPDTIPPDVRSKLEKTVRSIIIGAGTILATLQLPLRQTRENKPEPTSKRNLRLNKDTDRDKEAHVVQKRAVYLARNSRGKRSRRSGKSRPPVVQEPTSQDEEQQPLRRSLQDDAAGEGATSNNQEDDNTERETDDITEGRSSDDNNVLNHATRPSALERAGVDSTLPQFSVPTHQCDLTDLGLYTVPTLEKFTSLPDVHRTGMCHLSIQDFSMQNLDFDAGIVQDARRTTTQLKYNTACLKRPGVMAISSSYSGRPLTPFTTFTDAPRGHYSDEQLEEIFESFCRDTTSGKPQWYLIGSSKEVLGEQCRYSDLLTAGPYLQQALTQTIDGVNTSYIYASYATGRTATAMHYEDCAWFSVNLMLCGAPKIWLSIEPTSNEKFEAGLGALFPGQLTTCSQRIRHLSVLVAPSVLKSLGVKYHIKACYPGELIFTTPAAYHQIINMGANLAEAVNFMDRNISPYPQNYNFCTSKICGFTDSPGPHHFRASKRPWLGEQTETPPGKRRRDGPARLELRTEHYSEFASATPPLDNHDQDILYHTAAYHSAAKVSCQQADLPLLRVRANTFAYVSCLESLKGGAAKFSSEIITRILRLQNTPNTPDARRTLVHNFSTSKKWRSLCESHGPGLLALLPLQSEAPYFLCTSSLLKMNDADIKHFNDLLEQCMKEGEFKEILQSLCAIANGLVKRVLSDTSFQYGFEDPNNLPADFEHPHFEYRSEWFNSTTPVLSENDDLDLKNTLSLLRPQAYLAQSQPASTLSRKLHRLKATVDVTLMPNASASCIDAAASRHCPCMPPRLGFYRLSATSSDKLPIVESRVPYGPEDYIGELTGLLHSADHSDCSGTFCALYWPTGNQPICHLHWDDQGNWVRHIPHSCDPSAKFMPQILEARQSPPTGVA
ncbi:JmjC domain-containing histone demethylation protein 3D [Pyrenophora tritici-repentis]|uniref:Hydroxylase n=1 Tax=Pyrenophora tritici-repentis TaxID=45151 RepID=A0A2W1DSV3_9PLEO|nr:JmjC domain-containing histone demethylation protein 3D [Pyrenophora tritici-repentis]KAI1510402.1 hydroxylase [Pyrenophora tritici-repentis]KAI1536976.1 JmjC domain-containing histone demethylation protein 3D [Pyrenophora tritici-repentis]KAI1551671.1 JmjC domain-containing histone demethylation protein 3D [Pyrenophora tritici-repentis]KAI1569429.1 JmjC domain-containing histone demethylation protein 3D [Pyrenophora tritici-repentis]